MLFEMCEVLKENSKFFGRFYTSYVKDYFDEGDVVEVFSHYSLRLYTISKTKKIFKIHYTDFGKIFFNKSEWREKKINKLIQ